MWVSINCGSKRQAKIIFGIWKDKVKIERQIQIQWKVKDLSFTLTFLLQQSHILQLKSANRAKTIDPKMEATLFTSFGLLLTLMMKKTTPKFQIFNQFALTIFPFVNNHNGSNETTERQTFTPEKKKKPKKPKKLHRAQTQQFTLFPRSSLTQEMLEKQWRKKQQMRKNKCQFVGKEIQALQAYFLDDLQAVFPYNGQTGSYNIVIAIPGATYCDVPIKIKLSEEYPEVLPSIEIGTQNLHPLQKQKLSEIIKQQQELFSSTKNFYHNLCEEHSNGGGSNTSISDTYSQIYIKSYYPYILNLCGAISQELFYRAELVNYQMNIQIKQANKKGAINPIRNQQNFDSQQNIKEKQTKKEIQKQIYQNVVLQILNREDEERDNKNIVHKPLEYNMPKLPNPRGRYKVDYEQLQMIGEGGFGRVYRCKHRIDSNIYAVKKMVINYNDPQSFKLLKQVSVLSKLNHPNIVRYHQSWLEDTSSVEELITDMMITDPEEIQQFERIWKKYATQHPSREDKMIIQELESENQNSSRLFRSEEDSVIFGEDVIFGDYSSYPEGEQAHNFQYEDQSFSRTSLNNQQKISRKHSELYEFPFKILYIVMEYCGSMTLKDFINQKFNSPVDIKLKLIRGMLEGLSYIHSRRIIHRDLKPPNIFVLENMNKVKIGDFGLATIGNIQNNPYEAEIIEYSQKTKGVGTFFYRAPQQVHSSQYDEKIDIYSLGIILLEMFYQFDTNMERYQVLNYVTRTHTLPKDFNKVQTNSQFEQQIQSCISVKPSDRPTVQKLLQTFRNKYFTQLVSLIANPKHFQFYQLMNHLFGIKNQSMVIMKQNLYKNYLTDEFTKIYQIHRGVLFSPLSLIPVADNQFLNGDKIQANRKQKFLLLSQKGVVMEYPSNAYVSWIRYAKQTLKRNIKSQHHYQWQQYIKTSKQMRRFTFQKVAQFIGGDSKSQFSFKQKYVTAFDITYEIQKRLTPYFLCEMLKISLLMIETMELTQKFPPAYLCHSLIYKFLAIAYNVPLINLYRFLLSTSDEKFISMKHPTKLEFMKKFGLQGNIVKKIISLLEIQFQDEELFIASFKELRKENQFSKIVGARDLQLLIERIEDDIRTTVISLKIFKLYDRVKWKYQIPCANTHGIFWAVGPVKGFTSIEQYLPGQQLCNLHLETSLNPSQEENEAEVSIWSTPQYLQKDIMEVVAKCWENNITAKWYDKNLGEKDLSCKYNIILKKKNDRVFMMLRKNYLSFDRTLQKKNSEQMKDKEEKEGVFISKQHFNYQVLKQLSRQSNKKMTGLH